MENKQTRHREAPAEIWTHGPSWSEAKALPKNLKEQSETLLRLYLYV